MNRLTPSTAANRSRMARGSVRRWVIDVLSPTRARHRYTGSRTTSTARARTCAGSVTGMSSYSTPSGQRNWCSSQNRRRNSLFQAVRSLSRAGCFVTCVPGRVALNAVKTMPACRVPTVVSRWKFPVAKSEPVRSSEPASSSYALRVTMSSLSTKAR